VAAGTSKRREAGVASSPRVAGTGRCLGAAADVVTGLARTRGTGRTSTCTGTGTRICAGSRTRA